MLPVDSQPHLTTGLFCLVSGNPWPCPGLWGGSLGVPHFSDTEGLSGGPTHRTVESQDALGWEESQISQISGSSELPGFAMFSMGDGDREKCSSLALEKWSRRERFDVD